MTPSEILALNTVTFDVEHLIQITQGDRVLFTVGTPAGGHNVTEFCIWEGTGSEEDGEDSFPVKRISGVDSDNMSVKWFETVKLAYSMAVETAYLFTVQ